VIFRVYVYLPEGKTQKYELTTNKWRAWEIFMSKISRVESEGQKASKSEGVIEQQIGSLSQTF